MRRISAGSLALIALFAGYKLYMFLQYAMGPRDDALGLDWRWLTRRLFGFSFAGMSLSPSLIISFGAFAYMLYLVWEFLSNHEKTVDFLVETEKEMKKVSWPSWDELKSSSVVVVLAVLFLGAYLFAVDVILSLLIERIVGLG